MTFKYVADTRFAVQRKGIFTTHSILGTLLVPSVLFKVTSSITIAVRIFLQVFNFSLSVKTNLFNNGIGVSVGLTD